GADGWRHGDGAAAVAVRGARRVPVDPPSRNEDFPIIHSHVRQGASMKTSLTSRASRASLHAAVFALAVGLMPPTFAAGMDGSAGMDMKPAAKAMKTPQ